MPYEILNWFLMVYCYIHFAREASSCSRWRLRQLVNVKRTRDCRGLTLKWRPVSHPLRQGLRKNLDTGMERFLRARDGKRIQGNCCLGSYTYKPTVPRTECTRPVQPKPDRGQEGWGGRQEVPSLAEDLLVINRCWESKFSSLAWCLIDWPDSNER